MEDQHVRETVVDGNYMNRSQMTEVMNSAIMSVAAGKEEINT
jgi:hypothetical protein